MRRGTGDELAAGCANPDVSRGISGFNVNLFTKSKDLLLIQL